MGLSVSIENTKVFEAVTEMIQPGVLADIIDKGQVPNKFKPGTTQHKCCFVWIVAEEDSEGRNKRVFKNFTVSLHEKASLRKFLGTLGYKDFEKGSSFELESLIGTQRMLVMSEEDGENGKKYVNITATMPLKKGLKPVEVPKDFTRKKDRTE
jgi:hypothetical protein